MDRPPLPTTDRSAIWLADLIKASEVLATSGAPCDPAAVKALSHRLEMPADVRPSFELWRGSSGT
jgi:hypothetical protein